MEVGDKVFIVRRRGWRDRYYEEAVVEKKYKTGNIVVKGKQYRVSYDGKSATETGDKFYYDHLILRTPETEAQWEEIRKEQSLRHKAESFKDTVAKTPWNDFTEEEIDALTAILEKVKARCGKQQQNSP